MLVFTALGFTSLRFSYLYGVGEVAEAAGFEDTSCGGKGWFF